jgi:transcriptional regulator with XRE-family HTH domain
MAAHIDQPGVVGADLRIRRIRSGKTAKQLSELLDISEQAVCARERSTRPVSTDKIVEYMAALAELERRDSSIEQVEVGA